MTDATLAVPIDLAEAIERHEGAREAWPRLDEMRKREWIEAIEGAADGETRRHRIDNLVAALAVHEHRPMEDPRRHHQKD